MSERAVAQNASAREVVRFGCATQTPRMCQVRLEKLLYVPGDDLRSKSESAAIAIEALSGELVSAGLTADVATPAVFYRAIKRAKLGL